MSPEAAARGYTARFCARIMNPPCWRACPGGLLILLLLTGVLGACGQTGPLYQPQEAPQQEETAAPPESDP